MEPSDIHTILCASTTFHQMKLEVRTGLPWALGEGQTVVVHSSQDLREVTAYAGMDAMVKLRENQEPTNFDQVNVSVARTTRNGFTYVFTPKATASPTTEFEEKDCIVSCLFYSMLAADQRGASSIVIPLLVSHQTARLSTDEFMKLHLQAFIIYAQKGRPQTLKKVVYMPEHTNAQVFLDQLLEFAEVFSEVDYYGTADEQAMANRMRVCNRCQRPREHFELLRQSPPELVCDYCLLRLDIQPFINNPTCIGKIRCEVCKSIKEDAFHNCKLVCQGCAVRTGLSQDNCICLK